MKKRKFQFKTVVLSILVITFLTTVAVTSVVAGYSVSSEATVVATVVNPRITLNIDGDNSGLIIPGTDIVLENAPEVNLEKGSSPCYIFITVEKSDNFDDYMYFTLSEGWYKFADADNVFFRINEETVTAEDGNTYSVFADNTIRVYSHLTRMDIDALTEDLTLTVSAVAIHKNDDINTAVEAWAAINNQ